MFDDFIRNAPLLEHLSISFYEEQSFLNTSHHLALDASRWVKSSALVTLQLGHVHMTLEDLIRLLKWCAPTLQTLQLWHINLLRGSWRDFLWQMKGGLPHLGAPSAICGPHTLFPVDPSMPTFGFEILGAISPELAAVHTHNVQESFHKEPEFSVEAWWKWLTWVEGPEPPDPYLMMNQGDTSFFAHAICDDDVSDDQVRAEYYRNPQGRELVDLKRL